jgi:dolichyl-phosphate beta-glucosyltransferase
VFCSMQKAVIVVPCYNEEKRFDAEAFAGFLDQNRDVDLCFVNDGSSDGTSAVLGGFARRHPGRVELLDERKNRGKAEAVRLGMLHVLERGSCPYVGYWDADLATPLDFVPEFLRVAEARPGLGIIMGSRIRRMGADVRRSWYRHYLGRLFGTAASILLKIPVYDTQCGAKIIKAGLARKIFAEPFVAGWIFDVELLARALGETAAGAEDMIYEAPLGRWIDVSGSKLKPAHYFTAMADFVRIWRRYKIKR